MPSTYHLRAREARTGLGLVVCTDRWGVDGLVIGVDCVSPGVIKQLAGNLKLKIIKSLLKVTG